MIKAEVVFDGDLIKIGKYIIEFEMINGAYHLSTRKDFIKWCETLEQAVKYCMEN